MCTAATYQTRDFYFGRTLDYEFSYGDEVTITPRGYTFAFRHAGRLDHPYAIIGMAHVAQDYPLYYDAMNEKGLCIAGLNFVGNAAYANVIPSRENVAQFELIPYLLVLAGGIAGIQVFVVLLVGIVSGAIIMLGSGQTTPWEMLTNMGSGTSGMFETSMVAILVAAMCALIRENGGFDVLLNVIHRIFRGKRGGQFGVGLLVTLLDIATANNTVAIVMANPIAKEISEDYGISARKTASLLDTFSCISQGILPYGAQMLVALSAVHELGYELSAFEVMPLLFYPGMLFISSLICIFLLPERGNRAKAKK